MLSRIAIVFALCGLVLGCEPEGIGYDAQPLLRDAGFDAGLGMDGGDAALPEAGMDGGGMDGGGTDAGPGMDAGNIDAGFDAGADAGGVEAGVDAGFDSGVDGGPPCDAGPMGGFGDSCTTDMDCPPCGADFCAIPPSGPPGTCTILCTDMPAVCPPTHTCFDLRMFDGGMFAFCL